MPRKCVICNVYDKNNEKSFYSWVNQLFHFILYHKLKFIFSSFPKCGEQKKLWMNVCNIKLCLPSFKICQDHFKEQDFTNGCPRKNAVPFLNNVSSSGTYSNIIINYKTILKPMILDWIDYYYLNFYFTKILNVWCYWMISSTYTIHFNIKMFKFKF